MTAEGFAPRLRGTLLDEMTPDRKLYIDSLGIFIPTPGGLYLVKTGNRSRKVEDKREGKRALRLTAKGDIYTLLRTDSMLLAFAADGIYAVEGYRLRLLLKADWSQAAFGLTVRKLQSVGLTIADEHTVYHYDGTTLQQLVTGINLIRDIMVDRWGRLWIATYQGVYCFFNGGFTNHRLTDQNDIVRAVVADEDNRLVMGTLNGKVLTLKTSDNKEELPGDAIEVLSDDDSQYYGTSAVSIGSQTFIPIHGEYKHMYKHAELAKQLHIPDENIFIAGNGSVIETDGVSMKISGQVPAGRVLIDGLGVGACCSGAGSCAPGCPPTAQAVLELLRRAVKQ